MKRPALNKPLPKYPRLGIDAGCSFCTLKHAYLKPQETQHKFYSECIYAQRLWTAIRDWAAGNHDAS